MENLGNIASQRQDWKPKERKRWVTCQRRQLLKGNVNSVIEAIRKMSGDKDGKNGKKSNKNQEQRDYFINNQKRMDYVKMKFLKLPQGSGAIESAIRRVVNFRLKSASIYWYRENAEALLMLRAYYKAGNWNFLKKMANSPLSLLASG